jgi:hypothetical protein
MTPDPSVLQHLCRRQAVASRTQGVACCSLAGRWAVAPWRVHGGCKPAPRAHALAPAAHDAYTCGPAAMGIRWLSASRAHTTIPDAYPGGCCQRQAEPRVKQHTHSARTSTVPHSKEGHRRGPSLHPSSHRAPQPTFGNRGSPSQKMSLPLLTSRLDKTYIKQPTPEIWWQECSPESVGC